MKKIYQLLKRSVCEISNIKVTLDVVNKSMKQQEDILTQFEKKYGDILRESTAKKSEDKKENKENKEGGGVLV